MAEIRFSKGSGDPFPRREAPAPTVVCLIESEGRSVYSEAAQEWVRRREEIHSWTLMILWSKQTLVFTRESDFKAINESRFIDLKIDFSSESKPEYPSTAKMGDTLSALRSTSFGNFTGNNGDEDFRSGGSCRITVNDRGIKRGVKTHEEFNSIYSVSTFNFLSSSSSLESNDVSS